MGKSRAAGNSLPYTRYNIRGKAEPFLVENAFILCLRENVTFPKNEPTIPVCGIFQPNRENTREPKGIWSVTPVVVKLSHAVHHANLSLATPFCDFLVNHLTDWNAG